MTVWVKLIASVVELFNLTIDFFNKRRLVKAGRNDEKLERNERENKAFDDAMRARIDSDGWVPTNEDPRNRDNK